MPRVNRLDYVGALGRVERTPQGGLRVPAAVTRAGVLRYKDSSGREWGELRPPEEVFSEDSLATLRGAPVTDLHPSELVTPATHKSLAVGHVHDSIAVEAPLVVATLTVADAGELALVESGDRKEVSCGYTCEVEPTAGVYEGEHYDGIQRSIRYNHVGLGPAGWGRGGPDVSLRMDGAAVQVPRVAPPRSTRMKTLKVKGREYKLDADGEVTAAQDAVTAVESEAASTAAELGAVKNALMEALKTVAGLEARLAAAESAEEKPVTEDMVPEAVADSIAQKRVELVGRARRVLGDDARFDGKSSDEIRRAVIAKAAPTVKLDGLSGEVITGMFEALTASNTALAAAHQAAVGDPNTRSDGKDPSREMSERTAARWQQPLTVSPRKG